MEKVDTHNCKSTLDWAMEYKKKGFSVIPVKRNDKKPAINSWKEYQERIPTDDELKKWFSKNSKFNIGIVTGKISGITVLDFDSYFAAVQFERDNKFLDTPLVKTSKGFHSYCKYKEGVRNFQKRDDLPDIDLRGDGGYVVAPPSSHPSGHQYVWVEGKGLDDIPFKELPEIVLVKNQTDKEPLKELYKGTTEGSRNNDLTRLVGSWVHNELDYDECLENARIWNLKNDPPLPEKEVVQTIKSILQKHETEKEVKEESTQAKKLLSIASSFTLFHDQDKEAFVFHGNEVRPLKSRGVKRLLSYKLYKAEGTAPSINVLNQVITTLEGKAIFESPEKKLFNRVAKKGAVFWYDLGKGEAVRTTKDSWTIVDAPILFRKYSHQEIQVKPKPGGDPWKVLDYFNINEEHDLLVLVTIISCFIPEISHPIIHPHGSQGSGKTTLCKSIKRICDPSSIDHLITPKNRDELVQVIAHHHVCIFDNMSYLNQWMSDILCQACTGGGFSKRELYSDDEDIIYQFKRCIGINGINLLVYNPDLMDRSILLPLERIEPNRIIEETRFWKEFEKDKPSILGGIFDVLVKAMAIYPSVKIQQLPRMADFARWGYAISEALGRNGSEFLKAYQKNVERQNQEVIQSNTLFQAVSNFMATKTSWRGLVSEAYELLEAEVVVSKEDKTFPRYSNKLRKALEKIKPNLLDHGITYSIADFNSGIGIPMSFKKVSTVPSKTSNGNSLKTEDTLKMPEDTEDNMQTYCDDLREIEI